MADDKTQRAAFSFLRKRLLSQQSFTREQFANATGWKKPGTIGTYLRKHYSGVIEDIGASRFRVTDAFWKLVTWPKFKAHVTQVRRVTVGYEPTKSDVLLFDFLMPLTNEEHLRMSLDSLFYRDRGLARLKTIGVPTLKHEFPKNAGESDGKYLGRAVSFIAQKLVGYSISHVNGRFRSDTLLTEAQASALHRRGERYLVDETTAIVRFIFPYKNPAELRALRHLFHLLFVRSIIQLVNGEEQIWMIEGGTPGTQLHVWERTTDAD